MILKVYDPPTQRWIFFDHIQSAYVGRKIYTGKLPPIGSMEVEMLPEKIEGDISVVEIGLTFATNRLKPALVRFLGGNGYLLNDDGKTIERL